MLKIVKQEGWDFVVLGLILRVALKCKDQCKLLGNPNGSLIPT